MLEMTGVSKAYRSQILKIFALRDFSLHVKEGEVHRGNGPRWVRKDNFSNHCRFARRAYLW
jgi:putative ABC transport system ATP-binding protein